MKLAPPLKPTKKPKTAKADQVSLFDMKSEEAVSNDGKPNTVPLVPITAQAVEDHQAGVDERRRIEELIKIEGLRTLSGRTDFCLFAAPLAECAEQFRAGRYFGCIALTQALLEAVIRDVWQIKLEP